MNDYRYFPCPDLPPLQLEDSFIAALKPKAEVQPSAFRKRFQQEYQLSDYDVAILTEEKETAIYFDALCHQVKEPKSAANWLNGPIRALQNEGNQSLSEIGLTAKSLSELINLVDNGKVVYKTAIQQLLPELLKGEKSATILAEQMNLLVEKDSGELQSIIQEVLISLPKEVEAYKKGKKKLIGLFMGEVMKKTRGKATPKDVQQELNKALSK
jgi:aspartyl-tRNA(Asn)/glutamyl-tRNA(Gln) amidotransferase subunit B